MDEGTHEYNVDCEPVVARGSSHSDQALEDALAGPVGAIISDASGQAQIRLILNRLATTEFQTERVKQIIATPQVLSDWRVGEAIAESFLTVNRACKFPWPFSRDHRNPNQNSAGADLVGYQLVEGSHRFAFGEVKTSSDVNTPPQVVYGRLGLAQQIENLKHDTAKKNALVRYLAFRLENGGWKASFEEACTRYLADNNDISLFGLLIRDTEPDERDLRSRAESLSSNCPPPIGIELRSMYLPTGCLQTIAALAKATLGDS